MEKLIVDSGADEVRSHALERGLAAKSGGELEKVAKLLKEGIEDLPDVEPEAKESILQHVTSDIRQGYGARTEAKAIEHYEAKEKVRVHDSNLKFYKRGIGTINGAGLWVGGRIDGRAGGRVVEVKNRLKRFMKPLPKYDLAQLQTYLHILDSPEGELVEHLRNKKETQATVVPRDENMWKSQIEPNLMNFANGLMLFMEDPDKQRQFLGGDTTTKKSIITSVSKQKWH